MNNSCVVLSKIPVWSYSIAPNAIHILAPSETQQHINGAISAVNRLRSNRTIRVTGSTTRELRNSLAANGTYEQTEVIMWLDHSTSGIPALRPSGFVEGNHEIYPDPNIRDRMLIGNGSRNDAVLRCKHNITLLNFGCNSRTNEQVFRNALPMGTYEGRYYGYTYSIIIALDVIDVLLDIGNRIIETDQPSFRFGDKERRYIRNFVSAWEAFSSKRMVFKDDIRVIDDNCNEKTITEVCRDKRGEINSRINTLRRRYDP